MKNLARKSLLTESEFLEILQVESSLVLEFEEKYGVHSLDEFGSKFYVESLTSIMFDYWRSFLAIHHLVEKQAGSVHKVFRDYHEWDRQGRNVPLTSYMGIDSISISSV
ncbi:hypothetical protein [Halobacillus sp. BBL2006]|uniref:hypothetical protein n=1 Tax=Halobacillus sp. BBL2006 TaxID=1543706 RepID=UPI001E53FEA0|nr:hypothetical protein [Halobacillus sp. BBL2006]